MIHRFKSFKNRPEIYHIIVKGNIIPVYSIFPMKLSLVFIDSMIFHPIKINIGLANQKSE